MAFFFSREGPVEEFGGAEELAEALETIEMSVVLWHVTRCTGAEDFVGGAGDFGGGAVDGTGREGFEDSGREGIAEELGHEAIGSEALGL